MPVGVEAAYQTLSSIGFGALGVSYLGTTSMYVISDRHRGYHLLKNSRWIP